jgi:hypothetical protein
MHPHTTLWYAIVAPAYTQRDHLQEYKVTDPSIIARRSSMTTLIPLTENMRYQIYDVVDRQDGVPLLAAHGQPKQPEQQPIPFSEILGEMQRKRQVVSYLVPGIVLTDGNNTVTTSDRVYVTWLE